MRPEASLCVYSGGLRQFQYIHELNHVISFKYKHEIGNIVTIAGFTSDMTEGTGQVMLIKNNSKKKKR